MIYLITGLPGNGKTLYTIAHVRERAKKENRPVFYSGIPDLKIAEWQQIPEGQEQQWFDLPEGAIVVLDESQRIFRPRPGRGEPPKHVSMLETHRHKGLDLYLITQHPSLIDQNVRRLTGTHRHVVRSFGLNRAVIHEWGEVHLDCEKRRADSSKTRFTFPKSVYGLYKSAEVHTHGVQLPKQVFYLLGLLVLLGALFFFLKTRHDERTAKPEESEQVKQIPVSAAPDVPGLSARTEDEGPLTVAQYVESITPRVEGFPHTAPRYDEITKPVKAPYPAGCFQFRGKCKCITDQGTPIDMQQHVCTQVLRHGFYKDWQEPTIESAGGAAAPHRGTKVGDADAPPPVVRLGKSFENPPSGHSVETVVQEAARRPQVPIEKQLNPYQPPTT